MYSLHAMNPAVAEVDLKHSVQSHGAGRILILGHSGFIGRHLEKSYQKNLPAIEVIGHSLPKLDLTQEQDAEKLADLLNPHTAVVVLAGVKRQLGDNLDTFAKNVQMAVNLCRILERHPVKRVVFFSSAAVYGEEIENLNITEETAIHPTSLYGAAKYTAECLFGKVIRSHDQSSLLIVRPPLIYGPDDAGGSYGPSGFSRAALKRETITIWGDGREEREFVFVEDVTEIVSRLTFEGYSGVLNVASGRSYTYVDILDILAQVLGEPVQTNSRPRSKNKVDHRFSNALLTEELPGLSFTSLEAGVRQTIAAQSAR
jgi:UDP-glucose 4-epimerase